MTTSEWLKLMSDERAAEYKRDETRFHNLYLAGLRHGIAMMANRVRSGMPVNDAEAAALNHVAEAEAKTRVDNA